ADSSRSGGTSRVASAEPRVTHRYSADRTPARTGRGGFRAMRTIVAHPEGSRRCSGLHSPPGCRPDRSGPAGSAASRCTDTPPRTVRPAPPPIAWKGVTLFVAPAMGGAWAARLPPAGFRRSAADAVPGGLEQVCIAVMMLTPAAAALLVLARVHRVPGVPRAVGPARPGRSTACWAAA